MKKSIILSANELKDGDRVSVVGGIGLIWEVSDRYNDGNLTLWNRSYNSFSKIDPTWQFQKC